MLCYLFLIAIQYTKILLQIHFFWSKWVGIKTSGINSEMAYSKFLYQCALFLLFYVFGCKKNARLEHAWLITSTTFSIMCHCYILFFFLFSSIQTGSEFVTKILQTKWTMLSWPTTFTNYYRNRTNKRPFTEIIV